MRLASTVVILAAFATAQASDLPFAEPIAEAERLGMELSRAIAENRMLEPESLANFEDLRRAVDASACEDMEYRYYAVPLDQGRQIIYAIASSSTKKGVVIGRHFRATTVGERADLASLAPSTRSCLVLPLAQNSAGLMTTHLLSPTPTEFHVLASIVNRIPIFVSARENLWEVENGKIRASED
jgi:hypothetical protein